MIEVIKHGNKKFIGKCYRCGCEFKYETNDIIGGGVLCPECSEYYVHPKQYSLNNNECNHEWEYANDITSAGCLTYRCRRCGTTRYEYQSYLNNFGDIK